ncbi:MAG: hypothetical protein AAF570_20635, partial [Bacteroidota bacterium]
QQLAGDLWTDFNAHDPGVTLLEQLCFAITELGVRCDTEMADILEPDAGESRVRNFFTAAEILPARALTLHDFRALVIDCPGVLNAWVHPHSADGYDLNGVLEVSLEYEAELDGAMKELEAVGMATSEAETEAEKKALVAEYVWKVLQQNRNLCESFERDFVEVKPLKLAVAADIELVEGASPETVLAKIWFEIDRLFTGAPGFYTIGELLEKGRTADEIFDGPMLQHGFVDPAELHATADHHPFRPVSHLYVSHLTREVMGVEGVVGVSGLSVSGDVWRAEKWVVDVRAGWMPRLDLDRVEGISFRRGSLQVKVDDAAARSLYEEYKSTAPGRKLNSFVNDLEIPTGTYRALDRYHTLQNDFPAIFRIGAGEMPLSAKPERLALARQLKAYLVFFEQLLADFFKHLSRLPHLFSLDGAPDRIYTSQVTSDIPDFPALLQSINNPNQEYLTEDQVAQVHSELLNAHAPDANSETDYKNRLVDYLLGRFCERFSEYAMVMYANTGETDFTAEKYAFLADYPAISRARGAGQDLEIESVRAANGEE